MSVSRKSSTTPVLRHESEIRLPELGLLAVGDDFEVARSGRYGFRYVFVPDGSVTGFGPLSSDGKPTLRSRLRSFAPSRISRIHTERQTMKLTSLTYHQHGAIVSAFNLDDSEALVEIPGLVLKKTTVEFPEEEADRFAHVISDRIYFARVDGDRGACNALGSIARKLEDRGVYVDR